MLNSSEDGSEDAANGALQEHLKKIPCLMQQLTGDRENLKTKNALLLQFVRGLSTDLNDCQSGQKKYKVNKSNNIHSHLRLSLVTQSSFQTATIVIKSIRIPCSIL